MDWNAVKVVIDLAALLLAISAWGYAWWVGHRQAQKAEIEKLKGALAETDDEVQVLDKRVSIAEGRLDAVPTKESIHEIALSVAQLHGDIRTLAKSLDGMSDLSKRVERQLGLLMEDRLARQDGGTGR